MHVQLVDDNPAFPGELLWCGTSANKKHGVFRATRNSSSSQPHESVLELDECPLGFSLNNSVQVLAVAFLHRVVCFSWPTVAVIGTVDFGATEVRRVDFIPLTDGVVALTVLQSACVSLIELPPDATRAAATLRETPVPVVHIAVPWAPLCALAAVGGCFWVLHPHGAACIVSALGESEGGQGAPSEGTSLSKWALGRCLDVALPTEDSDADERVLLGGARINSDIAVAFSRTSLHLLQTSKEGAILLSSPVADIEARCDQIAAVARGSAPNTIIVALWSSDSCVRVHALQWSVGEHDEAGLAEEGRQPTPRLSLNELMGEVSTLLRETDEVKWCGSVRGAVVVAHGSGFFGLTMEPVGDTETASPSGVAAAPTVSVAPVTPVVDPVPAAPTTSVSVVLPVDTHLEQDDDDTVNIADGAEIGLRASSENGPPHPPLEAPRDEAEPDPPHSTHSSNSDGDEQVAASSPEHSRVAEPTPVVSTSHHGSTGASLVQSLGGMTQPTPDEAPETPQVVHPSAKVTSADAQPSKARAAAPAKPLPAKSEREPMAKALRATTAAQRQLSSESDKNPQDKRGTTPAVASAAAASRAATATKLAKKKGDDAATFRAGSPPLPLPSPKPSVPRLSGRQRNSGGGKDNGSAQRHPLNEPTDTVAAELHTPAALSAVLDRSKPPRAPGVDVSLDTDDLASRREDMHVYVLTKLLGEGWETPVIFIPLSPGNFTLGQIRQTLERIHQKRLSLAFATPAGKLIELRPSTMKLFQGYDDEIKQIYCRALFPTHVPEDFGVGGSGAGVSAVNSSDRSHPHNDRSNTSSLGALNVSAIAAAGATAAAEVVLERRKLSSAEQRSVCARLHDLSMEQMQRSRTVLEARYWPRESSAPVLTHAREKLVIDRLYHRAYDSKNASLAALQKKVDKEIFGAKPAVQLTEEQRKEVADRFYTLGMNQIRKQEHATESKGLPKKEFKKIQSPEEWSAWQMSMAREIGRKFKTPDPYSVNVSQ